MVINKRKQPGAAQGFKRPDFFTQPPSFFSISSLHLLPHGREVGAQSYRRCKRRVQLRKRTFLPSYQHVSMLYHFPIITVFFGLGTPMGLQRSDYSQIENPTHKLSLFFFLPPSLSLLPPFLPLLPFSGDSLKAHMVQIPSVK